MTVTYPVGDHRILKLGRAGAGEAPFPMHWTGSGILLKAACAALDVRFKAEYDSQAPWAAVLIDGAPVGRFCIAPGEEWIHVLLGMDPGTTHEVAVLRDSQPVPGDGGRLLLTGIRLDGTLFEAEKAPLNVGLIGDSLTVGEGCLGPVGAGEWKTVWMSGALTWGAALRRGMPCRTRALCLGGWGVYSGWDGDLSSAIPRIYEQVCAPEGVEEAFDFSSDPLDAAVINLGTNDMSALRALPEAERGAFASALGDAAKRFILRVHEKEPSAVILWAYGLCGDEGAEIFRDAVGRARAEGAPCAFAALTPFTPDETGSRGHPGPLAQARAGREIARELKRLMAREKRGAK